GASVPALLPMTDPVERIAVFMAQAIEQEYEPTTWPVGVPRPTETIEGRCPHCRAFASALLGHLIDGFAADLLSTLMKQESETVTELEWRVAEALAEHYNDTDEQY